MEREDIVKGLDLAQLFAAGAASVAYGRGMTEKDAESFVDGVVKEAARRQRWDDDEDDTFWSRNKGWLTPLLVGSLAFWAGADGERHGLKDKSYLANAGNRLWSRTKSLLGVNEDPMFKAVTQPPEA